jgi:hypothetical protein
VIDALEALGFVVFANYNIVISYSNSTCMLKERLMFTLWAYSPRPGRVCGGYNMAGCSKSNGHNMGYPHFSKCMHINGGRMRIGGG